MYTPAHFEVDQATATAFLQQVRAADLVTATEDGLVATHLPLLFDAQRGLKGALVGHLARTNDQWRRPCLGEALLIAHGPEAYISPSWYPSKVEHGRVVPTWNYTTAHVYGELRIHDDVAWLDRHVRALTERHEGERQQPWRVDDAPAGYVAGQLRAIVGVELVITRVETKFKLSQNRPSADIDGVVTGLTQDEHPDSAALVQRHRP